MKITEIVIKFLKAWFEKILRIVLKKIDALKEEYPVLQKYLKVPGFVKKIKPMKDKLILRLIELTDKLKKKYPVLEKYLVLPETGKKRALLCRILAAIIIFVSVFGIGGAITRGEKVNVKKTVAAYNEDVPDTSYLYENGAKKEIAPLIDELDGLLAQTIAQINIEEFIYSDEAASIVTRLIGEFTDTDFDDVKFKALKKNYPDAYDYLGSCDDWSDVKAIPFGIAKGDKEAFIKACGAAAEFLGNDMISIFADAPAVYDDALVPALESLHTGKMPTLTSFVFKTGLSGSARVEFIIEKILSIIEPIKTTPVTYFCQMAPDFITNYQKACDFMDDKDLDLELPEIEDVIGYIFGLLNMTYEPIDLDYLASLGTAKQAESGGNKGKRVEITGDREAVFIYIVQYVLKHITYENNFESVEQLFSHTLKEISPDSFIGKLMYSDTTNKLAGCAANILAHITKRYYTPDYDAFVQQYNTENADLSAVFEGFMSEDRVSQLIDTLDSTVKSLMDRVGIENIVYTDTIVTSISKLTATFSGKELSDISFAAMKRSYPEAYAYIEALKADGKTWDDVGVIPFGITPGDKEAFIKACGAGAEHFGDVLALSFIISPNAYEEALMPVLEALQTGPMSDLQEFIGMQGIDSARRMELITEKLISILEPIKEAPVTYFCTMLPEFIYSYNIAADCFKNNPDITIPGVNMLPINEFVAQLSSEFGLVLPEYDLNQLVKLGVASVAPSGDRTGKRIEILGDREAVFASLAAYVRTIISDDANVEVISNLASELLGISAGLVKPFISLLKTLL